MFGKRRLKKKSKRDQSPRRILITQALIGCGLMILLGLLGAGVWYGTRIESLTLHTVEVVGGETINHESIKKIVNEALVGEYFHLIPRRFTWLYPEEEIETSVRQLARVKNVEVYDESQTVYILFEEYHPAALWCGTALWSECVFLDDKGYAFAVAPRLEGGAFLRFVDAGREPRVGETVFDGSFIEDTNFLVQEAYDELGLNIIVAIRTAADEIEYQVAGGGAIKVSTRQNVTETLENLASILASDDFSHLAPGNFKYIDLRYGNKVFINEELNEETASSTELEAV